MGPPSDTQSLDTLCSTTSYYQFLLELESLGVSRVAEPYLRGYTFELRRRL